MKLGLGDVLGQMVPRYLREPEERLDLHPASIVPPSSRGEGPPRTALPNPDSSAELPFGSTARSLAKDTAPPPTLDACYLVGGAPRE
jgi:hypothetical protein